MPIITKKIFKLKSGNILNFLSDLADCYSSLILMRQRLAIFGNLKIVVVYCCAWFKGARSDYHCMAVVQVVSIISIILV